MLTKNAGRRVRAKVIKEGACSESGRFAGGEHDITVSTLAVGSAVGLPPGDSAELNFDIEVRVVPTPSAFAAGLLLLRGPLARWQYIR